MLGLTWITKMFMGIPFLKGVDFSNLGEMLSGFATAIAVFYAIVQYWSYNKDEKIRTLNEFNQRYATDKSIEKVVRWMLRTALYDENGKIVGKDPEKNDGNIPEVFDKELFMRFYEELNFLIDKHLLNEEDTLHFFAYYALVFDEYASFREDITDYDSDQWTNFHSFINRIKQTKYLLNALDALKRECTRNSPF